MYLRQLVQIVFQEGYLLFLRERTAVVLVVLGANGLLYSSLQILDE